MNFISQGDYVFPFHWMVYWLKHFYLWSFQTGASNLDGVMRLPGRLVNVAVFAATGNQGISYFYIGFSMLLIGWAFYLFAGHFLDIKDRRVRLLGGLFFALNPIFLGYLAKIGLLVGVAMLPLCFVVLRYGFITRKFRYFVLYFVLLNVSLIHPFTFAVNIAASGTYALSMLSGHGGFLKKHKVKLLGTFIIGVALNLYFILPVMSLGTVSKSALSENISQEPVDYTSLVDFANSGNPLTALSLSRDVLLDFRYYNESFRPVYFAAVFIFYGIIFGLYLYIEPTLEKRQRARMVIMLSVFILLLLLSMATFFGFNLLIKTLITLPGGWAFRSPLKWQLYIPFVLAVVMCLLLAHTENKRIRSGALAGLASVFLVMNAFLGYDIYRTLLTPKQFQHLGQLNAMDLEHKNMLYINDAACFSYLQENLGVVTEMNQVFTSKQVQLKRIKAADAHTINLEAYDYVFGCSNALAQPMQNQASFEQTGTYIDGMFKLYKNQRPRPYIYATEQVVHLDKQQNVTEKSQFITKQTGVPFDFAMAQDNLPMAQLTDPFEGLTTDNIQDEVVESKITTVSGVTPLLYMQNLQTPVYQSIAAQEVTLSNQRQPGMTQSKEGRLSLDQAAGEHLKFAYKDPTRNRRNFIDNPSLEDGKWQEKVWDCYAYDDKPSIGMGINTDQKYDGKNSLELRSRSHIACSGPPQMAVRDTARYLLYFRYNIISGTAGGYGISFNDPEKASFSDRLATRKKGWQYFIKEIEIPKGATKMQLTAQAYPGPSGTMGRVAYDDFGLVEIPNIQGKFYVMSPPKDQLQTPQNVSYSDDNPTKKTIHITGATTPFYLAMRDTYHDKWQLSTAAKHMKLNGFMNGWYIDPVQACQQNPAVCTKNPDGSYDLRLRAEFTPQIWFYKGLLASGAVACGVALFFVYSGIQFIRRGKGRYWRWLA